MKEELEQEVRDINNIIFMAVESFKIVEYLAKNDEDPDKSSIKSRNNFFSYTMITNWRITVIELSKLLSGGKNEAYDLRRFINKLQPSGVFDKAAIDQESIKTGNSNYPRKRMQ